MKGGSAKNLPEVEFGSTVLLTAVESGARIGPAPPTLPLPQFYLYRITAGSPEVLSPLSKEEGKKPFSYLQETGKLIWPAIQP